MGPAAYTGPEDSPVISEPKDGKKKTQNRKKKTQNRKKKTQNQRNQKTQNQRTLPSWLVSVIQAIKILISVLIVGTGFFLVLATVFEKKKVPRVPTTSP